MSNLKLSIELVPETCWWSNVRTSVPAHVWTSIKKEVSKAAGYRCEICSGRGITWPVECHEVWHYDDTLHLQVLKRMIALCPACHEVKHFGYATIRGRRAQAFSHFQKINKLSEKEAELEVASAFEIWHARSVYDWKLDIKILSKYGIDPEFVRPGKYGRNTL